MPRRTSCGQRSRSMPSSTAPAPSIRPGGCGTKPRSERHVTDLPDPDSPTIPSVSPRSMQKDTPSTARTTPLRVWKDVRKSSTSSSATPSVLRCPDVERIAQAVAEEIQREQRRREYRGRVDQQPRRLLHLLGALLDEQSPGTHRRLHAESEETQKGLQQHHRGNGERRVHHHGTEHIGDHVAQNDAACAQAERDRRLDEFLPFERQDLPAHDARLSLPLSSTLGGAFP